LWGKEVREVFWEGGSVQDVRVYARKLEAKKSLTWPDTELQKAVEGGDKRSPQQRGVLQDYYLTHHDAGYQEADQKYAAAEVEKEAIKARSAVTHIQEEVPGKMPYGGEDFGAWRGQ